MKRKFPSFVQWLTRKHMDTDYIIVGQGIAGTTLAHGLAKEGKKTLVIDHFSQSSSSNVATGLFNPVVFKRLVKSWKVDLLLPVAEAFYKEMEMEFKEQFYFKKELIKLFTEDHEKDFWLKKAASPEVGTYLSKQIHTDLYPGIVNDSNGWSEVLLAGYVSVSRLLELYRKHLLEEKRLLEEKFDFNSLSVFPDHVNYRGVNARKIVFCEGYKAIENPFFNYLHFKLTKGEVLTLRIKNFDMEKVLIKGVFILPLGNELFKIGATYEWKEIDELPTDKGRKELLEKFESIVKAPYEVLTHQAGVRPTVEDRRPLIGLHPKHPAIGIFNGMGTKGVMLAPFFAGHFIDFMERQLPLDKEVDIHRYLHSLPG